MSYLIYCLTGIFGGVLMGLVGFGIGPIAVPAIALTLDSLGTNKDIVMQIAIATSLSIIVLNTFFTAMFHKKNNNINFDMYKRLLPGSLIGAIFGSILVIFAPTFLLKYIFAIILIVITCAHFFRRHNSNKKSIPNSIKLFIYAFFIAMLSNLIGVSDGILMIPFLTRYDINIKESIGTATALVLPVSFIGLILFVIFGSNHTNLPPYSIGFIYTPAVLIIAPLSIICSYYSVKISKCLSDKLISNMFCIIIVGISLTVMFNI